MMRRMSEKRIDYSCAWCNLYTGSLKGLVAHLVCSHSRFRFQVVVGHDKVPHIYVLAPPPLSLKTENFIPSVCELDLSSDDELDSVRFHPFTYISNKKKRSGKQIQDIETGSENFLDMPLPAFDDVEELSTEPTSNDSSAWSQRQYFHSRTGAVVLEHERDYDSDDDVDEEWIIKQSEKVQTSSFSISNSLIA